MSYTPFINDPTVGEFVAAKASLPWREMGQDMADILNAFLDAAARKAGQLESASVTTSISSIVPRLKKARLKDSMPMIAAYVRWLGDTNVLKGAPELAKLVETKGAEQCAMDEKKRTPAKSDGVEIGRNDPCKCGSGKKFKKCCGAAAG